MVCTTCGEVIFIGGRGCACIRAARHQQEEARREVELEIMREELASPEILKKLVDKAKEAHTITGVRTPEWMSPSEAVSRDMDKIVMGIAIREDDDVEGHPV